MSAFFEPFFISNVEVVMKIGLLSLFLLLTSICKSQDTISVHSRQWAGGVCCSSGNDIFVYLPIQKTVINIDSVLLFIQGITFDFTGNFLMDYGKVCSFSFGWRKQNCYTMDCESIGYYGIERNQIGTSDSLDNRAIFYYSNGTKSDVFVKYTEDYLAYP